MPSDPKKPFAARRPPQADDDEPVRILDPVDDEGFADARDRAAHDATGHPLIDRALPDFNIPDPPLPPSPPRPPPVAPKTFRRSDSVGPANETVFSIDPADDFGEYDLAPSSVMEPAARPRPLRQLKPTTVFDDRNCRKCGYSLLGLPSDARCPECGTPIVDGGGSDLLCFASGEWLGQIVLGCRLVMWGLIAYVASFFGAIALVTVAASQGISSDAVDLLGAGVNFGLSATILGGAWLLTTPDPSHRGEAEYGMRRKAVRVLACFGLGAAVCGGLASLPQLPTAVQQMAEAGNALLYLPWLAGHGTIAFYLKKVAERIPDPYLADRAEFVASALWGASAALGVVVIGTIGITLLKQAAGPVGAGTGIACGACLSGLLLLTLGAFLIVYVIMLEGFARRIDEQRKFSDPTASV